MDQNKWWKKAVVYQVYPRSFKDSNADGVGDLVGIIQKLDYLKELGVGAIWLSPVYKSPMVDFGYDISEHTEIDPIFGTLDDFKSLLKEAHERGINIMMDFVPNHTSNKHPWFLESKAGKNSPKRQWYIWADGASTDRPPNNWLSVFGGSGWQWDETSGQYYFHTFAKEQPDLNWENPEVKKAQFDVLKFWLDLGVDGFRVDAIHWLHKDNLLRDDPVNPSFVPGREDPYHMLIHLNSQGQDPTLLIVKEMCELLESYPDKFMVTEVHADIPTMIKYFRSCSNKNHAPFNFNLIGMPWDAMLYKNFIDEFERSLEPGEWPNYVLGNHDKPRIASRLGQVRSRLAGMLQFTLRGMPFVYYGEEIGMEDGLIPQELAHDPFEKNLPGFKLGRDPERTPMQWDGSQFAGFSDCPPWLPIAESHTHFNVEAESADSRSHLNLYKTLIKLRAESEVLLQGGYQACNLNNDKIFAFYRQLKNKKVLVVLNFSDSLQIVNVKEQQSASILFTTAMDKPQGEKISLVNLQLRDYEGLVLEI